MIRINCMLYEFLRENMRAGISNIPMVSYRSPPLTVPSSALRPGAASVCLLSMTFLLGASRLGFFVSLRLTDAFGGIEISFLLGAPL